MYTHYLGIDLHKRSSVWTLVDQERQVVHTQSVSVTPEAITSGVLSLPTAPPTVQAVIEPVCGWRWVQSLLAECGIVTVIANPAKVRLIAASKHKTDANDARMLAELLASGYLPEAYRAPEDIAALRTLVRQRHYLIGVRTGMKNRLIGLVTAEGLLDIQDTVLTKAGAARLRAKAQPEFIMLQELIGELTSKIDQLERSACRLVKQQPIATLLATIPTIGPISLATIIAEVGDFGRFKTAKQLTSYAGLVPGQRSSGAVVHRGHITKVGSKYLRYTLVECAMRFRSTHDPALYEWFLRVKQQSSPMKARVALARKLLTIIWYIADRHTPYTPRNHEAE